MARAWRFVLREVFERRVQVVQLAFEHFAMARHRCEERVQLRHGVGWRFVNIEQIANFRQREAEPFATQRELQARAVAA